MASPTLESHIPMRGDGFYNAHAAQQHRYMLKALPLLQKSERPHGTDNKLTVLEYGSAQGINSILPFETILQKFPAESTQLIFNDRPENDFNTLAQTIGDWTASLRTPQSVFVAFVPLNFYKPVVAPQSVDVGFSFACLHFLRTVPRMLDEKSAPIPGAREACRAQAHADFRQFLRLRAVEVRHGGSMVLTIPSYRPHYRESLFDASITAMQGLADEGRLPKDAIEEFLAPVFFRTLPEVRTVLEESVGDWATQDLFEEAIIHPAIEELEKARARGNPDEASEMYASEVIDWLMGWAFGLFSRAVRLCSQTPYTDEGMEALSQEWIKRSKKLFLERHRDEPVATSFIYVRLQRR